MANGDLTQVAALQLTHGERSKRSCKPGSMFTADERPWQGVFEAITLNTVSYEPAAADSSSDDEIDMESSGTSKGWCVAVSSYERQLQSRIYTSTSSAAPKP